MFYRNPAEHTLQFCQNDPSHRFSHIIPLRMTFTKHSTELGNGVRNTQLDLVKQFVLEQQLITNFSIVSHYEKNSGGVKVL